MNLIKIYMFISYPHMYRAVLINLAEIIWDNLIYNNNYNNIVRTRFCFLLNTCHDSTSKICYFIFSLGIQFNHRKVCWPT